MENEDSDDVPNMKSNIPEKNKTVSENGMIAAVDEQDQDIGVSGPLMSALKMPEIREIDSRRRSSLILTSSQETLNYSPFRRRCHKLIHSFKFQAVVIGFVILDCIFVIAELVVDLRITKGEVCDKVTCESIKKDHSLSLVLQSLSLGILSLFMVELLFKLYTLRADFFRSKMEMFDAIIVIVSWSLDIVFFEHVDETHAITLLISFRMWRLIRIVHAIAMSMITPVTHKLEDEKHAHHTTQHKLEKLDKYSKELEVEIKELKDLLKNSNRVLPNTKLRKTSANKTQTHTQSIL